MKIKDCIIQEQINKVNNYIEQLKRVENTLVWYRKKHEEMVRAYEFAKSKDNGEYDKFVNYPVLAKAQYELELALLGSGMNGIINKVSKTLLKVEFNKVPITKEIGGD